MAIKQLQDTVGPHKLHVLASHSISSLQCCIRDWFHVQSSPKQFTIWWCAEVPDLGTASCGSDQAKISSATRVHWQTHWLTHWLHYRQQLTCPHIRWYRCPKVRRLHHVGCWPCWRFTPLASGPGSPQLAKS